jgi:hypothetical protein
MAAATREDIRADETGAAPFTLPASNDTELDLKVAEEAERQKRETGQSEDSASIKSRILAEGFERKVYEPKSVEDDMRMGHESTEVAKEAEVKAEPTFTAEGEPNEDSSKRSSKK